MLENAEKVREQFSALIDKAESASELETAENRVSQVKREESPHL